MLLMRELLVQTEQELAVDVEKRQLRFAEHVVDACLERAFYAVSQPVEILCGTLFRI